MARLTIPHHLQTEHHTMSKCSVDELIHAFKEMNISNRKSSDITMDTDQIVITKWTDPLAFMRVAAKIVNSKTENICECGVRTTGVNINHSINGGRIDAPGHGIEAAAQPEAVIIKELIRASKLGKLVGPITDATGDFPQTHSMMEDNQCRSLGSSGDGVHKMDYATSLTNVPGLALTENASAMANQSEVVGNISTDRQVRRIRPTRLVE